MGVYRKPLFCHYAHIIGQISAVLTSHPTTTMHTKRIVIIGALILVAIAGIAALISSARTAQSGSIILDSPLEAGTTVFLNNKRVLRVQDSTEPLVLDGLSVGTHTIVVGKDGHWPWSKELVLANGEQVTVHPFVVPQEPALTVLTKEHNDYAPAQEQFSTYTLPNADTPLLSSTGSVALWISENALHARWLAEREPPEAFCFAGTCNRALIVLPADKPIRNVAFFGNRDTVVVFGSENGIFALELDKRGTQNFQPLYLGTAPEFVFVAEDRMVIRDEGTLFALQL